ncbi:hypothetical protein [Tateyamaria sp. 1078]|uniref:hypothetical protein n=2 Tax=Tateyamaria TaxID=299261 RepID=UPI003EC00A8D
MSDLPVAPPPPPPPPVGGLVPPSNLFSSTQMAFDTTAHIDLRSNWSVVDGRLTCLGVNGNDVRMNLDDPLVAGRPYFVTLDPQYGSANVKINLSGSGSANGRNVSEDWQGFQYFPPSVVDGNFTRASLNPSAAFTGSVDDISVYDLSSVDPHIVPCDVIIIGGDSNSANATSDFVTKDNRETAYDPRMWYMPCLRTSPTYGTVGAERHMPFPMIEPVLAAPGASRMSPVHAAASRLVGWSAGRDRPLLVMALGDPGSGLMNTQDWRHPSRAVIETTQQGNTASRMWNEMMAMKSAVEALGPAHEVVGAIWSLGQNDGFNTPDGPDGYDTAHTAEYHAFFAGVRAEFGNIPMVLTNIAQHIVDNTDGAGNPGFGSYRQQWLNRFDKDSGHPNAISDFRVIQPASGNQVDPLDPGDPHYNAAGMQQNGRDMGDALLSLITSAT